MKSKQGLRWGQRKDFKLHVWIKDTSMTITRTEIRRQRRHLSHNNFEFQFLSALLWSNRLKVFSACSRPPWRRFVATSFINLHLTMSFCLVLSNFFVHSTSIWSLSENLRVRNRAPYSLFLAGMPFEWSYRRSPVRNGKLRGQFSQGGIVLNISILCNQWLFVGFTWIRSKYRRRKIVSITCM